MFFNAGEAENGLIFSQGRNDQQGNRQQHQKHRGPHPGNKGIMTVIPEEEVLQVNHVAGYLAVQCHKNFATEEKHIGDQGIGHDSGNPLNGFHQG